VRVVVLPAHASVEVEGEPAKLRDGILEIEGIPGSVHRVRVFMAQSETIADVVVTEAGALPPKIEVTLGQKVRLTKPRPTATSAQTAPAATTTTVPKGINTATDEFE